MFKRITRDGAINVCLILDALEANPVLHKYDMADIIGCTPHGAVRYLKRLSDRGIIRIETVRSRRSETIAHLIAPPAEVAKYRRELDVDSADAGRVNRAQEIFEISPGHLVRCLFNELGLKRRVAEVNVHRDPLDLAFFGTGPAPSLTFNREVVA